MISPFSQCAVSLSLAHLFSSSESCCPFTASSFSWFPWLQFPLRDGLCFRSVPRLGWQSACCVPLLPTQAVCTGISGWPHSFASVVPVLLQVDSSEGLLASPLAPVSMWYMGNTWVFITRSSWARSAGHEPLCLAMWGAKRVGKK